MQRPTGQALQRPTRPPRSPPTKADRVRPAWLASLLDTKGKPDGQNGQRTGRRKGHQGAHADRAPGAGGGPPVPRSRHLEAMARFVAWLQFASYRLVGHRMESESPHLRANLERAGFAFSPGMYRGLMVCVAGIGFLLFAALGAAGMTLSSGLLAGAAAGLALGSVAGGLAATAFPFVVRSRIQNRSHAIDKELPFALSELSVLAGIGLSPIVLMRRMALRPHDPATSAAFRQIVAMVDTEGRDLVSAMAETARQSPSDALRTTLWDMANLMHQGGDIETYLKGQSENVLEQVRAGQKSFTEQLGTYADMYISIVLLGIMFLAIGAFLIDAFRTTAGPLTADAILLLLTWGFGPVVVIVLGLLLSSAHGSSQ